MKKVLFAIFAHPDDEAFGPSGTLLMEAKSCTDVHLITLTLGEAGSNPDNVPDLATVREAEWRAAGELIGASGMHFLGYNDGQLNNLALLDIQEKLLTLINTILDTTPDVAGIEFMSMDTNGISGHIDHIVASRSACFAFYRLKEQDSRVTRIRLACTPENRAPHVNTEWIFMEAGRSPDEINEIVDARSSHDAITQIMQAHHSQRSDCESHIEARGDTLGIDHFIVKD